MWQRVPIHITLPVSFERRIDFPNPVSAGIPENLLPLLRIQNVGSSLYLLPSAAFPATRVQVQDLTTNTFYLLDLEAAVNGGSVIPVVILNPPPASPQAPQAPAGGYDYVALARFVLQQIYAPARLLPALSLPGLYQVPVAGADSRALVRGAVVKATLCQPGGASVQLSGRGGASRAGGAADHGRLAAAVPSL